MGIVVVEGMININLGLKTVDGAVGGDEVRKVVISVYL